MPGILFSFDFYSNSSFHCPNQNNKNSERSKGEPRIFFNPPYEKKMFLCYICFYLKDMMNIKLDWSKINYKSNIQQ